MGDVLFETFWIITGVTANFIALSLSFFLFAATWKYILNKQDRGE